MELKSLPTLQADIVKWMHHAHVPEEKERDFIIRLNAAINPHYFIYQPHHKQTLNDFKEFIELLEFKEKFINSEEIKINVISELQSGKGLS
jgi:hypothetical protein